MASGYPLRDIEIEATAKMLACGTIILGNLNYRCENSTCEHTKVIKNSCKSKLCHSCGQKATERWIATQGEILPDCLWRHITFTMPDVFWPLFEANRELLGALFTISSNNLLAHGEAKKVTIGIFNALHTYGRQLTFNSHIHLSVAELGITKKGEVRLFSFPFGSLKKQWRYGVITLLRENYSKLVIPEKLKTKIADEAT